MSETAGPPVIPPPDESLGGPSSPVVRITLGHSPRPYRPESPVSKPAPFPEDAAAGVESVPVPGDLFPAVLVSSRTAIRPSQPQRKKKRELFAQCEDAKEGVASPEGAQAVSGAADEKDAAKSLKDLEAENDPNDPAGSLYPEGPPLQTFGFFSVFSYWWLNRLMLLGSKRPLEEADLPANAPEDRVERNVRKFHGLWTEARHRDAAARAGENDHASTAGHDDSTTDDGAQVPDDGADGRPPVGGKATLWRVLVRGWWPFLLLGALLHTSAVVIKILTPLVIKEMVSLLNKDSLGDNGLTNLYLYATLLGVMTFIASILVNSFFYINSRAGAQMRSAIFGYLYRKTLHLPMYVQARYTSGVLANLMGRDIGAINHFVLFFNFLWLSPLAIVVVTVLLVVEVGWGGFAGVCLFVLSVPTQIWIMRWLGKTFGRIMMAADRRIKLLTEMLNGIRVVKMSAWEPAVRERVRDRREAELLQVRTRFFLQASNQAFNFMLPKIIVFVVLVVYYWEGNTVTVEKTFTVFAYIQVLGFPMKLLPVAVAALTEFLVAHERLNSFFNEPEIHDVGVDDLPCEGCLRQLDGLGGGDGATTAVSAPAAVLAGPIAQDARYVAQLREASFSWDVHTWDPSVDAKDADSMGAGQDSGASTDNQVVDPHPGLSVGRTVLSGVNVTIRPGELIGVIGPVGAGKSSFLAALTRELEDVHCLGLCRGAPLSTGASGDHKGGAATALDAFRQRDGGRTFNLNAPTVRYVSQDPFVHNATLRENILFGCPYVASLYERVLTAASLVVDFDSLPARDRTEIGEKGINLSGGQKARVSFARALYRRLLQLHQVRARTRTGRSTAMTRQEALAVEGGVPTAANELFLLDDIFAACDVSTAAHLFRHGVQDVLRGSTRVLVLSAHMSFLQQCDRILVFGNVGPNGVVHVGAGGMHAPEPTDAQHCQETLHEHRPGVLLAAGTYQQIARDYPQFFESELHEEGELDLASDQPAALVTTPGGPVTQRSTAARHSGAAPADLQDVLDALPPPPSRARLRVARHVVRLHASPRDPDRAQPPPAPPAPPSVEVESQEGASDAAAVSTVGKQDAAQEGASGEPSASTEESGTTVADVPRKPNDGKLMEEVARQRGALRSSVYMAYFSAAAAVLPCFRSDRRTQVQSSCCSMRIVVMLLMVVGTYVSAQVMTTFLDLWVTFWSASNRDGDSSDGGPAGWVGGYSIIIVLAAVVTVFRNYMFAFLSTGVSRKVHSDTFDSLLTAPINRFFDVTRNGVVLNRFSKDLMAVDTMLPFFVEMFLTNSIVLAFALVLAMISTPLFIIAFVFIMILFYYVFQYFRKSSRELKRMEGTTRAPIVSMFAESMNGLMTIRAYGMQPAFTKQVAEHIDRNTRAFLCHYLSQRWLALRLDLVSALIVLSVSILSIGVRDLIDPALVSLGLVYSLQFTGLLQWCVRTAVESENFMTSVERMIHFTTIPQEAAFFGRDLDPPQRKELSRCVEVDPDSGVAAGSPPSGHLTQLAAQGTELTAGLAASQFEDTLLVAGQHWPARGQIDFRNVTLRYRPGLPLVLKGLSLRVQAGHKVGICGRTGAGKSTLMLSLLRIVECCHPEKDAEDPDDVSVGLWERTQGEKVSQTDGVFIDGVNVQACSLSALRNAVSIIPQDPYLFSGTVRYNLDPLSHIGMEQTVLSRDAGPRCSEAHDKKSDGADAVSGEDGMEGAGDGSDVKTDETGPASIEMDSPEDASRSSLPSDASLWRVLDRVGLGRYVRTLPNGLDAMVEPGGTNFSKGQRQLLCIARALLKNTRVLILDEATSSVDPVTDALIQSTLRTQFAGVTQLVIAHRLESIMDADRIVVLDAGRRVAYDTPSRLLSDPTSPLSLLVDGHSRQAQAGDNAVLPSPTKRKALARRLLSMAERFEQARENAAVAGGDGDQAGDGVVVSDDGDAKTAAVSKDAAGAPVSQSNATSTPEQTAPAAVSVESDPDAVTVQHVNLTVPAPASSGDAVEDAAGSAAQDARVPAGPISTETAPNDGTPVAASRDADAVSVEPPAAGNDTSAQTVRSESPAVEMPQLLTGAQFAERKVPVRQVWEHTAASPSTHTTLPSSVFPQKHLLTVAPPAGVKSLLGASQIDQTATLPPFASASADAFPNSLPTSNVMASTSPRPRRGAGRLVYRRAPRQRNPTPATPSGQLTQSTKSRKPAQTTPAQTTQATPTQTVDLQTTQPQPRQITRTTQPQPSPHASVPPSGVDAGESDGDEAEDIFGHSVASISSRHLSYQMQEPAKQPWVKNDVVMSLRGKHIAVVEDGSDEDTMVSLPPPTSPGPRWSMPGAVVADENDPSDEEET